jgi:hypothetical protein
MLNYGVADVPTMDVCERDPWCNVSPALTQNVTSASAALATSIK